jgi:hypothetical protein
MMGIFNLFASHFEKACLIGFSEIFLVDFDLMTFVVGFL